MSKLGIDVSSYQPNIDWGAVKSQIDYAIIRLGYGDNVSSQDDRWFQYNVDGCINNGIPFGVYIYSYAKRLQGEESIQSEVNHALRQVSKLSKKPFCIYIDMEDENYQNALGKETLTHFATYFCDRITEAGYKAGVYANENWFRNYLDAIKIHNKGYSLWCARVSDVAPSIGTSYDIWQYSFSGRINGISGNVDMDSMINDIIGETPTPQPTNVNIYYKVKTEKYGWLPEVKNLEDYAGYNNDPVTAIAIRVDAGYIKYRGHSVSGKQFAFVDGYNTEDYYNGYAGNGVDVLDTIEVMYYTPDNIRPFKYVKYKVNNYPYQIDLIKDKTQGLDGYAGKKGVACTKFQAYIK